MADKPKRNVSKERAASGKLAARLLRNAILGTFCASLLILVPLAYAIPFYSRLFRRGGDVTIVPNAYHYVLLAGFIGLTSWIWINYRARRRALGLQHGNMRQLEVQESWPPAPLSTEDQSTPSSPDLEPPSAFAAFTFSFGCVIVGVIVVLYAKFDYISYVKNGAWPVNTTSMYWYCGFVGSIAVAVYLWRDFLKRRDKYYERSNSRHS